MTPTELSLAAMPPVSMLALWNTDSSPEPGRRSLAILGAVILRMGSGKPELSTIVCSTSR